MRLRISLLCVLALVLALAGCASEPAETTAGTTAPPPVEQLTLVVTEADIGQLEEYPDLKRVDLTGSTCYAAIADYMKRHPNVDVTYTVKLGTAEVDNRADTLVLDPGACLYTELAENLAYLPEMESVSLPRTTYTPQEITALQGLYPDVTWDFTIILLGQEITGETTEINMSVLDPKRAKEAAEKLELFPNLITVDLMDTYGQSPLEKETVKLLQESTTNITFLYSFDLFGKTVSTTDRRIEYVDQYIGNEGEEALRAALEILENCEYLLLDNCGFDNAVLEAVRGDYPGTQLVWRVWLDELSWLTDTDTIRLNGRVGNGNSGIFRYCSSTRYLDLSNNPYLTDISFTAYMPELELVLLSGCPITDLSPLGGCEKLTLLELAYCDQITDISPLAGCVSLANLNLSYTAAADMTALYGLPLEKLYAVQSAIPQETQEQLKTLLPDCWIRFDGTPPFGTGWCYEKNGYYTDIYARVREVFGMDQEDA